MSKDNNNNNSSYSWFICALTLIFVIFKLLGKVAWSWWWVFSPLWIGTGVAIAIMLIMLALAPLFIGVVAGLVTFIDRRDKKKLEKKLKQQKDKIHLL